MSRCSIGIDLGASTAKTVLLDPGGDVLLRDYRFHRGGPLATLREMLADLPVAGPCTIALTGSGADAVPRDGALRVDTVRATIAAAAEFFPRARNIIDIGGASLKLIRLDAEGRFANYSANSACAAGTGSFLDEQAMRLGLSRERMAELEGVSDPPPVATRCAVFAKSDLIHLQQAGASLAQMWSGLCRGMAQTALHTLLKGKPMGGPTALVGGVAQNREVVRWLSELAEAPVTTCADAHVAAALGAALVARQNGSDKPALDWREWLNRACTPPVAAWVPGGTLAFGAATARSPRPPLSATRVELARRVRQPCSAGAPSAAARLDPLPLTVEPPPGAFECPLHAPAHAAFASDHAQEPLGLRRTAYPSFDVLESYTDATGNEVRVTRWPTDRRVAGTLGIDIGSTSTKLCLVDEQGEVLADIYRKTAGDPIGATQKLFEALRELGAARRTALEIRGCGTTGSGRKLVGAVVGADAVINEISAHVAGALHTAPDLETIFEIGGQDSKYMRIQGGAIADANMNYVCAAGTGSFVEEQARKLGVPLPQVGDRVLGLVPPLTSDRCTVFMEQDVNALLRAGHDVDHALAAVMRSVVQNYLNKVVGNRPWSRRRIGFQGATARNKGLVAAFETLLGVEMVVSPYCHVMGAWGVALLTRAALRKSGRRPAFAGLELSRRAITLRKERCDLCHNECEITFAHIEGAGHEPSWGYLCGRDPGEAQVRVHREYDLFRKRRSWMLHAGAAFVPRAAHGHRPQRVSVPRALTFFTELPLWRRLLAELGAEVVLAPESTRATRERGAALAGADFCFPVKLAHGQVAEAFAVADADWVLVPRMIAQAPAGRQSDSFFCPYVQSLPAVAAAALGQGGARTDRLLAPRLDRRRPVSEQIRDLHRALGPALGVSRARVRSAHRAALATQAEFEARCRSAGQKALQGLVRTQRRGIVLVGRPYNVTDPSANLDLPSKIAEMGHPVFPIDFLPFEPERIPPRYHNVFWAYGQRILSALEFVHRHDQLFAIYFTNFNCGPDSFLLSYAEEIMGDKPMLSLELDEHGADTGYITRIEAFLDVVRDWRPAAPPARPAAARREPEPDELRRRRIWIPAMHDVSAELFAAAFRRRGYDAAAMPTETWRDFERGQRLTRGCECLPMRTTLGCFLNRIEAEPERAHALFMPTAQGPCRFGQYATLDRILLERVGHADIPVLAPSGDNAYCGLPAELRRALWPALLAADTLTQLACRVRPYEATAGDADAALERWRTAAARALESGGNVLDVIRCAGADFGRIALRDERRPLVGVVGEIYVRNNRFANEDLVRAIERAGGEVWSAPISEWILFTTWEAAHRPEPFPRTPAQVVGRGGRLLRLHLMQNLKTKFWKAAGPVVADRHEPPIAATIRAGLHYIPGNVGGETLIALGRAVHFVRQSATLIANASPFGCMAGTIATSLFSRFERETGVPVVNLFYEGTGGMNQQLDVFLANLDRGGARSGPPGRRAPVGSPHRSALTGGASRSRLPLQR